MNNLFDELLTEEQQQAAPQISIPWDLFHDLEDAFGVKGTRMVAGRLRKVLAALVKKAKSGEVSLDIEPEPRVRPIDVDALRKVLTQQRAAEGQQRKAAELIDDLLTDMNLDLLTQPD